MRAYGTARALIKVDLIDMIEQIHISHNTYVKFITQNTHMVFMVIIDLDLNDYYVLRGNQKKMPI